MSKPFIIVDGITYINQDMIDGFANAVYSSGDDIETQICFDIKEGSVKIEYGFLTILDQNGVDRVRIKL